MQVRPSGPNLAIVVAWHVILPHSIDCSSFVTCYWLKYSTPCLITLVCNLESLSLELLGIFSYDRMRKASKISPPSNQPHFFKIFCQSYINRNMKLHSN